MSSAARSGLRPPQPSCGRRFFPRRRWSQVGGLSTQAELRYAFAQWGLPRRIRVDNGVPWGSDDGLPTELECWLTGLGVTLVLNPPYRPQKNGVVERSQGVAKQWAEPHACATAEALQERLDVMDYRQRAEYPHGPTGQPRLQCYRGLTHSGRVYDPAGEAEQWSVDSVKKHLAEYVIRRRVDSQGKISVYNTQRFAGRDLCGRTLHVHLDPVEVRWVMLDDKGHELRRVDAPEVCDKVIRGMRMMYRLPCRPAPHADPVPRVATSKTATGQAAQPPVGIQAAQPTVG